MTEKKWATKINGKIVRHGAVGFRIGKVGSPKWKSYCSRSGGIAKKFPNARKEDSPNTLSRKKWRCGSYGLALLFFLFLSISFISAFEFDNVKSYDSIDKKITITNTFGLGSTIEELKLIKNTALCSDRCSAEKEIKMYKEGALIDDVRFLRLMDNGDWVESSIRSYQFYIKTDEKLIDVPVYEWTCEKTGKKTINGTDEQLCSDKLIRTDKVAEPVWTEYKLGTIMPKGDYYVKLVGSKAPAQTIDWQITSQGKLISEWAVWGGSGSFIFNMNTAGFTGTSSADGPGASGTKIVTGVNALRVIGLTRTASTTYTQAFIFSTNYQSGLVAQGTFSGSVLTFASPVILSANTTYWIMGNKTDGSTYDYQYKDGGTVYVSNESVPVGYNFSTTHRVAVGGAELGGYAGFANLLINAQGGPTITLNSPVDYYNSSSKTVNFNASASVLGGATLVNISLWHNASGTWERNYTTTWAGTSNNTILTRNFADGYFKWGIEACDSDGVCGFASENRTVFIDTVAPSISITYPTGTINGLTNGQSVQLNYSASDTNRQTCWREYNGINTTIASCANTTFTYVSGVNTIKVWANDSVGNAGVDTNTWTPEIVVNSIDFNSTTYETASETFTLNVSGVNSAKLIYNGTSYVATLSGDIITKNLVMNTVTGNKSFYWELNGGLYNSSINYQNVLPINLTLCNYNASISNQTITYVNYTFKDETTNTNIDAQIITSTFTYYLGDGTVTKSLIFSNTTSNMNYAFCANPPSKTFYVTPVISYLNTSYPQRTYSPGVQTYTNSTTSQTLYLLSSTDGIYVTFITTTSQSTVIEGATITISRTIGGSDITLGQGTTDNSGAYTIWLNPNFPHTVAASKAGYGSTTQTITPTQTQYTLVLSSGSNYSYVSNVKGLLWGYFPSVGLVNGGSQYFGFNVSSLYNNLVKCKIEVLNTYKNVTLGTGETIATNASYCTTQVSFNPSTSVYSQFKGRLWVDIGSGYEILEEDAYWVLQNVSTTGMTFTDWFTGLKNMDLSYFNGNEQHREYTNILIFFLVMMIICAVLNQAGWDIQTQGGMIFLVGFFVWAASITGFLNLSGLSPISLVNKYFVAIIYSMFMIGYGARNF